MIWRKNEIKNVIYLKKRGERIMKQPEIININDTLRLKTPKKTDWDLAYPWYQNQQVMYLSEGVKHQTYELDQIYNMYEYLSTRGELYFIEVKEDGRFKAIGDVTLWEENLPIAIGEEAYWGQSIGKLVIQTLLKRAKSLGMTKISVPAIYHYNERSLRLFESCGFKKVGENETEKSYEKLLR